MAITQNDRKLTSKFLLPNQKSYSVTWSAGLLADSNKPLARGFGNTIKGLLVPGTAIIKIDGTISGKVGVTFGD